MVIHIAQVLFFVIAVGIRVELRHSRHWVLVIARNLATDWIRMFDSMLGSDHLSIYIVGNLLVHLHYIVIIVLHLEHLFVIVLVFHIIEIIILYINILLTLLQFRLIYHLLLRSNVILLWACKRMPLCFQHGLPICLVVETTCFWQIGTRVWVRSPMYRFSIVWRICGLLGEHVVRRGMSWFGIHLFCNKAVLYNLIYILFFMATLLL